MVQDEGSAEEGHEAGSDGVRAVPDGLLGRKLGRLDPVCHKAAAWRKSHSLGVTVYEPKASDECDHSHRGLALAVHKVEQAVHLRAESYEYIHERGEEKSRGHHLLAADTVGDEAVDEP